MIKERRLSGVGSVAQSLPPEPVSHSWGWQRLDEIHTRILDRDVESGVADLFEALSRWRETQHPAAWNAFVEEVCVPHPIAALILEDPMTAHSFRRPRGYPGDAELLDYIYGLRPIDASEGFSQLAGALHEAIVRRPAARAVRRRRRILADFVDETAAIARAPRILAVAAGHLREARLSTAVREGAIAQYVALDQDARSLGEIESDPACHQVTTVQASIRDLLVGNLDLGSFDAIYAAGLYDYLGQRTVRKFSALLFNLLRCGGRLLVSNFLPKISSAGFMESYMRWQVRFRTQEELRDAVAEIAPEQIAAQRDFIEVNGNIGFLELRKA